MAALLSAILLAIEELLISLLGRAEAALSVMLHVTVFGCILLLIPALAEWQSLSPHTMALCLALGPVGLFAQYCTIRGYRAAPLSVVAPIDYTWLFFSALLGLVVFGEGVSLTTWLGCSAILLGGAGLARSGARQ